MRLGLISDIHGDIVALELAWAHLTVLGVDRIICAGDVVGYGPHPDRAAAFLAAHNIPTVRGNHDRWALQRGPGEPDPFKGATPSTDTLAWLETLPPRLDFPDLGRRVSLVHGSPRDDLEFITRKTHPPEVLRGYLDTLGAEVLVHGHTHEPMWYDAGHRLVVNPGSVISAPVVSTSRTFAVLDVDLLTVTFHDVESGEAVAVQPWYAD